MSESKVEEREEKKSATELSDAYKGFAETTSNVVQKAAEILEEEVAAGIVAAKRIEQHFLDVKELRDEKPDDVMYRLRRDVHEIVDIFVDLTQVSLQRIADVPQSILQIKTGSRSEPGPAALGGSNIIRMPQPIKAGGAGEVPVSLENNGTTPTGELTFYSTDFVSSSGGTIPADQLAFNPEFIALEPGKVERVTVSISVPAKVEAGIYTGLILARNMDSFRAVLVAQVE
jgi:hypothetical protein